MAIQTISRNRRGVVFLLWGKQAQDKARLIDSTRHHILTSAHPSGDWAWLRFRTGPGTSHSSAPPVSRDGRGRWMRPLLSKQRGCARGSRGGVFALQACLHTADSSGAGIFQKQMRFYNSRAWSP